MIGITVGVNLSRLAGSVRHYYYYMCRSKRRGYRWWFGSVAKEAVPQTAGSIERETLVTEPAELGMRAATLRSDT